MAADTASAIELIISCGIGGAALKIIELVIRKFTGRRGEKVSEAERLNAIAIALVAPINTELEHARQSAERARQVAEKLRGDLEDLRNEFEDLMSWARHAKRELDQQGIAIPPIPLRRVQ